MTDRTTDRTTTRPTTRDVARAAGVSLATVDRVLNGRAGVRTKTVESVQDAIRRIGFERDPVAAALARRRDLRFAFALPEHGDQFLSRLTAHVAEADAALGAERVRVEVIHLPDGPHRAAERLDQMKAGDWDGLALLAPGTPVLRDAIGRLRQRGIPTVAVIADQRAAARFVGIDNRAAGATAGALMGRFAAGRRGSILVLTDRLSLRDAVERRLGFDTVIGARHPHLRPLPSVETRGDAARTREVIARALELRPDLVGVYMLSLEAQVPLRALAEFATSDMIRIAHERTPFTETALREGLVDAIITQDTGHVVRSAIRTLRAEVEGRPVLAAQERIRIEILLEENL
ncbi:LacI family DNA-binding transcriptional regulator [Jannaschia ovalis]|uniref:LacI family DNA-binding transcriptional regulator n=1 Tax=Jannaschia ovalis TaxID=3038773 RepID=A0ABY8LB38_9RHOB|nr:LacI family DNA-binding transcriptional regulator [Jannaschia sp. GRR-S6-38]WGH78552.1 LacI family DNA-binding transcriptional regulator [Jannaschia sp. GRR-S6-38]